MGVKLQGVFLGKFMGMKEIEPIQDTEYLEGKKKPD